MEVTDILQPGHAAAGPVIRIAGNFAAQAVDQCPGALAIIEPVAANLYRVFCTRQRAIDADKQAAVIIAGVHAAADPFTVAIAGLGDFHRQQPPSDEFVLEAYLIHLARLDAGAFNQCGVRVDITGVVVAAMELPGHTGRAILEFAIGRFLLPPGALVHGQCPAQMVAFEVEFAMQALALRIAPLVHTRQATGIIVTVGPVDQPAVRAVLPRDGQRLPDTAVAAEAVGLFAALPVGDFGGLDTPGIGGQVGKAHVLTLPAPVLPHPAPHVVLPLAEHHAAAQLRRFDLDGSQCRRKARILVAEEAPVARGAFHRLQVAIGRNPVAPRALWMVDGHQVAMGIVAEGHAPAGGIDDGLDFSVLCTVDGQNLLLTGMTTLGVTGCRHASGARTRYGAVAIHADTHQPAGRVEIQLPAIGPDPAVSPLR